MSRMKHLLRKLHIGGGVDEHHRLGVIRPSNNTSPQSSSPSPSSLAGASLSSSTPSAFSRNRVVDTSERAGGAVTAAESSDSSADFSFFEDEFQVQLALAISASDPDARQDQEAVQIKAAKRMSLGCPPPVAADETLVEYLSLRYWNYNFVNYDERVVDGFYDVYGITSNSNMEGKIPLLVDLQATSISENVDYEVILVNRSADPALRQLERKAVSIASECQTAELGPILSGLVQKIADLVVGCMGGPVVDADEMLRRWTVRSYELRNSLNTNILPLGCLDVGLSCHRALLFKVLADRINLPCRLVKGSYYTGTDDGAVNLIKVDYDSEYIIDLMGSPGTLIPAEIPNNCLQNSGSDVRSSVTIAQNVEGSCFALGKVNCQFENQTSEATIFGHLDHVSQVSLLGSDDIGIQAKKDDANISEKNQTEKFEYEFGKLFLSLHKPHESSSGTGVKASSAQKVKVKDVSEYVISAAQDPEFAQKLHAVLLESGASPPPDLFSVLTPQVLEKHTLLGQSQSVDVNKFHNGAEFFHDKFRFGMDPVTRDRQQTSTGEMAGKKKDNASDSASLKNEKPILNSVTDKPGFACSSLDLHCDAGKTIISHGVCSPPVASGVGFMLVNNKGNDMAQDDSTVVDLLPALVSSLVRTACEEKIQDCPAPCAVGSYPKELENIFAGGEVNSQGNAGVVNNVETGRNNSLEEHQLSAKELIEPANYNQHFVSGFRREQINPMLDEVAEIPWVDLQIGERIGLGSYGEVYRADWNGTEVAVKKFLNQDFSGDALEQFRCEIRIMQRLRHPNIVLFMGAVTLPPNLSIMTEFLPRGSLHRLLHRPNVQLDEKLRLRMALDVAKGMNCLHTSHPTIVHRDLKSPNLLVDKDWVVKVCDFGLSRLQHHTYLSSKSTAGTAEWMAPEVLRNEPSNEKCDVYSFGVILWELATLRMPWSWMNPMQVVGAVGFQNRRLDIPEEVDPIVGQIISDCWQSDPNLRPSFAQLMFRLKHLQRLAVERT
ncbi:serine/threonine-protein kinase EDR1 [Macadamia integrifolia]|uniref:serine/threonine-protein kinase EDR1 n=1 Tax=Macadamia integrifolia TaxID=60698 RepID=UPI001C4E4D51|nr:serine/threonine-protein kinase EDR1 [Macadamia integrifolia]